MSIVRKRILTYYYLAICVCIISWKLERECYCADHSKIQSNICGEITINVLLFKKLRDIIFFAGQFSGQKSRGPLKMSREMAQKAIVPKKKLCPKVS